MEKTIITSTLRTKKTSVSGKKKISFYLGGEGRKTSVYRKKKISFYLGAEGKDSYEIRCYILLLLLVVELKAVTKTASKFE